MSKVALLGLELLLASYALKGEDTDFICSLNFGCLLGNFERIASERLNTTSACSTGLTDEHCLAFLGRT